MSLLRTALRVVLATVAWWLALYPALAMVGVFVLPPDAFTQLLIFATGSVIAVLAAVVFVHRSGSLRQLVRFAIAVFLVDFALMIPISALSHANVGFGYPLAVLTALTLIVVSYGMGYYLIYENGYERAKSRFTDVDALD